MWVQFRWKFAHMLKIKKEQEELDFDGIMDDMRLGIL